MKFRLMSDLHLEFDENILDFNPVALPDDAETVLILAGDIAVGIDALPFLDVMAKRFYHVIYILGNHEYYHQEVNELRRQWREAELPANVTLLDNEVLVIEDGDEAVRIVGGTLWTDFNGGDWFAMQRAKEGMNDFSCVQIKEGTEETGYRERRWLPEDAIRAHKETLFAITEEVRLPFDGATIVVTHHLPHPLCVDPQFRNHPLNAAYATNLDMHIEEYDIDVWCHGHTHSNVDVEVHGTRILCNPRGYVDYELNNGFIEDLTFEV